MKKKTLSESGYETNYEIYNKQQEGDTTWFDTVKYKSDNGQFTDEDWTKVRYDMDDFLKNSEKLN